jgi:hypothetical protein
VRNFPRIYTKYLHTVLKTQRKHTTKFGIQFF